MPALLVAAAILFLILFNYSLICFCWSAHVDRSRFCLWIFRVSLNADDLSLVMINLAMNFYLRGPNQAEVESIFGCGRINLLICLLNPSC